MILKDIVKVMRERERESTEKIEVDSQAASEWKNKRINVQEDVHQVQQFHAA